MKPKTLIRLQFRQRNLSARVNPKPGVINELLWVIDKVRREQYRRYKQDLRHRRPMSFHRQCLGEYVASLQPVPAHHRLAFGLCCVSQYLIRRAAAELVAGDGPL